MLFCCFTLSYALFDLVVIFLLPRSPHPSFFFFFNDPATPEIYPLPLHAALPIFFFLPPHPAARDRATAIIEDVLHGAGLPVLGWRDVPVEPAVLGPTARATCPAVRQAVIAAPAGGRQVDAPAWERSLYLARRIVEQRIAAAGPELEGFFACSLSCRTVVYNALLTGTQLPAFFPDLVSPDFESAIAVFHQRYSTNTSSSWCWS